MNVDYGFPVLPLFYYYNYVTIVLQSFQANKYEGGNENVLYFQFRLYADKWLQSL